MVVLIQSGCACSQAILARIAVIWRRLGLEDHFQDGTLMWLASWCWQLAGGLSVSTYRHLHRDV